MYLLHPIFLIHRKTRTERNKQPKLRKGRNSWKKKKLRGRKGKMEKPVGHVKVFFLLRFHKPVSGNKPIEFN